MPNAVVSGSTEVECKDYALKKITDLKMENT